MAVLLPAFYLSAGVAGDALPHTPDSSEAVASRLREELLSPKLDGIAADVAHAGSVLDSTFISPSLWLEPFLPTTAVEPVLPDPDAPNDPVAFKEVSLAEGQRQHSFRLSKSLDMPHAAAQGTSTNSASLRRRPHAIQGSREFVRGSLVSMPFTPGKPCG
eukprot:jgi/Astpho2/6739/Aster-x1397